MPDNALQAALAYSPVLREWCLADERLAPWLDARVDRPLSLSQVISQKQPPPIKRGRGGKDSRSPIEIERALRKTRRTLIANCLVREAAGAPLEEVVHALSEFADIAVAQLVVSHERELTARYGEPAANSPFVVMGMGKWGGRELNASSDIDLIYLFGADGETRARSRSKRISHLEFFSKLAQQVSHGLAALTDDGFVFRVDTRLRPYGEEGPLAVAFEFLEEYLVSEARLWERMAWLKARAVTGSPASHVELDGILAPFVYRRYHDYDVIEGLRDLHQKIRAEGHRTGGESNIKLGRGGIRELEFFVQAQQLVRGGREPLLRCRDTLSALSTLQSHGLLNRSDAQTLAQAYRLLRRTEHFLQYRTDQQTQRLPERSEDLEALAVVMGFASRSTFEHALGSARENVARAFETLAGRADLTQTQDPTVSKNRTATDSTAHSESSHGLKFGQWPSAQREPGEAYAKALLQSSAIRRAPAGSQSRIERLVAQVIVALSKSTAPLETLKRFGTLIERIAGRSAYLALFIEHSGLLTPLLHVLERSAWGARLLAQHPMLLDQLLDNRWRQSPVDEASWGPLLQAQLDRAPDTESKLNQLRYFQQSVTFELLLRDLAGELSIETLSDHLSALADTVVEQCMQAVWKTLSSAPMPAIAVIAYGRWGGKELGYGSDLDLVMLTDSDTHRASLGKWVQRFITWMSTPTSAGICYEIDMRLRPDGGSGVLLTTVDAFEQYQAKDAWTWEHQALTRARFAVGDRALGLRFEAIRDAILSRPREKKTLLAEVSNMRSRMLQQKSRADMNRFHVKNDLGGMVDIEFVVQTLVLLQGARHPFLLQNKGTIACLLYAAEQRLIPKSLATSAAKSYRALRAVQHQARLNDEDDAYAMARDFAKLRADVESLWDKCGLERSL